MARPKLYSSAIKVRVGPALQARLEKFCAARELSLAAGIRLLLQQELDRQAQLDRGAERVRFTGHEVDDQLHAAPLYGDIRS